MSWITLFVGFVGMDLHASCKVVCHPLCFPPLIWTPHTIHTHKVRAHTCIFGNEIADTLANKGTLLEKPDTTPHIHIAHATPYWLASCPTAAHDGAIRNLHTFITKDHKNREIGRAITKFPYVEKWLTNTQINQKLSNHF